MKHCVISCGGTGGHLAPGISIAEMLTSRGCRCTLVISQKEVDSRLLKAYPHLDVIKIPARAFSLKPLSFLSFIFFFLKSVLRLISFMKHEKPDMVLGFGGFVTAAIAPAAFLSKVPIVLHEANRVPGKAIRLMSLVASRIYLPQGVQMRRIVPRVIRHYGYPVRQSLKKMKRADARKAMGFDVPGRLLLVLGGSQGAAVLNDWARSHFEALAEEGVQVVCVTGLHKGRPGIETYENRHGDSVKCHFMSFCDNMAALLSCADLVVARAGAGSIAEFSVCALPSILIPLPDSADAHQMANARFHEQRGGAVLLPQQKLDSLYNEVNDLIHNDWLLDRMRHNLKSMNDEDHLTLIVNDMEEVSRLHIAARLGQGRGALA